MGDGLPVRSLLGRTRRAEVSFHPDGRIDVSARVSLALSLRRGDVLDVLRAGRELWLVVRFRAPARGRHEASCRPSKGEGRNFRAWSARLCRAVSAECGLGGSAARLAAGDAGEPLPGVPGVPLLTLAASRRDGPITLLE